MNPTPHRTTSVPAKAIEKAVRAIHEVGDVFNTYENARAALETAAPLILAQEMLAFADELEEHIGQYGPGNRSTGYGRAALDLLGQLRARADELSPND